MPRRRPPRGRPSSGPPSAFEPASLGGWMRVEDHADGEWVVRSVSGSAATKTYRCPGCDQEVAVGVSHVVVWPADEPEGSLGRRHWHTGCWRRRHP